MLAKNGGEVIKQLEANDVDCVLMDINIPVKDGMECTREIRRHPNAKISAVAHYRHHRQRQQLLDGPVSREAGVTDYLPKPLDFDALVRVVKQHIG